MALTYYAGRWIQGTNSDRTGGTWTNLPVSWRFFETDTYLTYYWDGSAWHQTLGYTSPLAVNQGGTGAATLTGILKGNGTSAFTAVTAPTGTILGDTDTITIQNKTLDSTNTISSTSSLPLLPTERRGGFYGYAASTGPAYGAWESCVQSNNSNGGLFSTTQVLSGKTCARFSTGATINAITGLRSNGSTNNGFERDQNIWTIWQLGLTTITNARLFVGYLSAAGATASTADPGANLSAVGFWFDTGIHATNIAIMQNNGGASSDKTTIPNVGTMVSGTVFTYELRSVESGTKFQYRFNNYPAGTWTDINTAIPAATTKLGAYWFTETLASSAAKTFDIYQVHHRQDS